MPRPIATATIAFGLVSIPVGLYTATSSKAIGFHLLHARCGTRIQHRNWCPTCRRLVERTDLVRGFPIGKTKHVPFTDAELDALERNGNRVIEISTFVPLSTVDPIYYESTYYLAPVERGEKPYRLLTEAMRQTERVAVGSVVLRGKEHLVLLRPLPRGLVLHQLYYADEVRDFDEIDPGEHARVAETELALAKRLVAGLAGKAFDPAAYRDAYRERILAIAKRKAAGREVTVAPEAETPASPLDLMDALRRSLERKAGAKAARRGQRGAAAPVDIGAARARRSRRARAS
jgi:DNA end-binding protein Ku